MKKILKTIFILALVTIITPLASFGVYNLINTKANISIDSKPTDSNTITSKNFNAVIDGVRFKDDYITVIGVRDANNSPTDYLISNNGALICNINDTITIISSRHEVGSGTTLYTISLESGCESTILESSNDYVTYDIKITNSVAFITMIGKIDIPSVG